MIFVMRHEGVDGVLGTIIETDRWWDARVLYTRLYGVLPTSWIEAPEMRECVDYRTRWIGSAARSSAELVFQYKMAAKGAKWVTL